MGRARGFNLRYEIVDSCAKRRGEEVFQSSLRVSLRVLRVFVASKFFVFSVFLVPWW